MELLNLNILKMARRGLQPELISALREVVVTQNDICRKGLQVDTDGEPQVINLTVKPVLEPPSLRGLIAIIFEDSTSSERPEATPPEALKESTGQVAKLQSELKSTREYLQATIEELETSVEELRSANEELQSANEELQSTNEELETSREELQSVNEELVTVNSEHESNIQELSKANNDLNNLLAGTQIGTLFLDDNLCIQRFTPAATRAVNLIPGDIGRPLSHIASNLYYDRLVEDARDVLDTLSNKEKEVETKDGRWYNVRILPYRTTENVIQGAVITCFDITEQKQAQEQLRKLTRVIEQSPAMVVIMDTEGNIEYVNPKFTDVTGHLPQEVSGSQYLLLRGDGLPEQQQKQLRETLTAGREWRGEMKSRKKNDELYWESATISPLTDSNGRITHFVLVSEDITERRKTDRLATVVRDSNDAITLQNFEGRILAWNRGAEQMYGWREVEALAMNILDMVPESKKKETLTLIERIARGESVKSLTTRRVTKDGRIIDVWLTITTLTDAARRPTAIATTERDVTRHRQVENALRRAERLLQVLAEWNRALGSAGGEVQRLTMLCRLMVDVTGYRGACVSLADEHAAWSVTPTAQAGLDSQRLDTVAIPPADANKGVASVATALRSGQPVAVRHIDTDPAGQPWRLEAAQYGYASLIALPLLESAQILGALFIYATEADAFDPLEIELLETLANSIAHGLHAVRANPASLQE